MPLKVEDCATLSHRLLKDGICVVRGAIDEMSVLSARKTVLESAFLFKNTRNNKSAGHLAGFHRFPKLEHLHALALSSKRVASILDQACHSCYFRTIGLSDITINRSQEWHVDLLRGEYRSYLDVNLCWHPQLGGGVYKVLLYLQSGKSLRYIAGSHLVPVDLEADPGVEFIDDSKADQLSICAGDIVVIDIRLAHRGSSESQLEDIAFLSNPKILISTVLGSSASPLAREMEIGNFSRLMDWDKKHSSSSCPELNADAK
jgi:hypothetical protein